MVSESSHMHGKGYLCSDRFYGTPAYCRHRDYGTSEEDVLQIRCLRCRVQQSWRDAYAVVASHQSGKGGWDGSIRSWPIGSRESGADPVQGAMVGGGHAAHHVAYTCSCCVSLV